MLFLKYCSAPQSIDTTFLNKVSKRLKMHASRFLDLFVGTTMNTDTVPSGLLHRRSGDGRDVEILANRQQLYKQTKERNPLRWSGKTRSWIRPVQVWLNPAMKTDKPDEELKETA